MAAHELRRSHHVAAADRDLYAGGVTRCPLAADPAAVARRHRQPQLGPRLFVAAPETSVRSRIATAEASHQQEAGGGTAPAGGANETVTLCMPSSASHSASR